MSANASLLRRWGLKQQVLQGCRCIVGLAKLCLMLSREVLAMPWADWNVPFLGNTFAVRSAGVKCCCCHWAAPSSSPYNMGSALWSRTILKACPASNRSVLTSRISSGWAGGSWSTTLVCASWSFVPAGAWQRQPQRLWCHCASPCHKGIAGIAG